MPSGGNCSEGLKCNDGSIPTCSNGGGWVLVGGIPVCSDGTVACSGGININSCTKCLHCLNVDIPIHINSEAWSSTSAGSIDLKFGVLAVYIPNINNAQENEDILRSVTYHTLYTYTSNNIACVSTQTSCQKMLSIRINENSDLEASDIFDYMCTKNGTVKFIIYMSTSSSTVTEIDKGVIVDIPSNVAHSIWTKVLKDNTNLMLGTKTIATLDVPVNALKVSSIGNSDIKKCCTLHTTNPLTINIGEPNCFNLSILYKFATISTQPYTASIPINWNITVNVYIAESLTVALSKTSNITLTSNQDIFSSTPLCTTQLYGCFVATAEQKAAMKSAGYIKVRVTINDVGSRDSKLPDLAIGYTETNRLNTKTIYSLNSNSNRTFILEAIRIAYSNIDFTGNKAISVTNITALNYSSAEGIVNSTNGMNEFHVVGDTCATIKNRNCINLRVLTVTSNCKHNANSAFTNLNLLTKLYFLSAKPDEDSYLSLLQEIRDVVPKSNVHSAIKHTIEVDAPYYNLNDYKSGIKETQKVFNHNICGSKLKEALLDSSVKYVFFTMSIYNPYMYENYNTAFYRVGDVNDKSLSSCDFESCVSKTARGLKDIGWHRIGSNFPNMNLPVGTPYYTYRASASLRSNGLAYLVKTQGNGEYSNSVNCDTDSGDYIYDDSSMYINDGSVGAVISGANSKKSIYMGYEYVDYCAGDYRQFYSKKAVYLYGVDIENFISKINKDGEWRLPNLFIYFGKSCIALVRHRCLGSGACTNSKYYYVLCNDIKDVPYLSCIDV
jgi:hypothetical protein